MDLQNSWGILAVSFLADLGIEFPLPLAAALTDIQTGLVQALEVRIP